MANKTICFFFHLKALLLGNISRAGMPVWRKLRGKAPVRERTTGRTVKQQNKDMKKTVLMLRTVMVLQLQFKAGRIRFGGCRCADLHFLFEGELFQLKDAALQSCAQCIGSRFINVGRG